MTQHLCTCGFIFDEDKGLPSKNILPGTDFSSLSDFECPRCGNGEFEEIKKREDNGDVPVISASYDRIKDWVMDPKGYFTIKTFPEEKIIKVRYYTNDGVLQRLIEGKKAMDIYNTIVREGFVSYKK